MKLQRNYIINLTFIFTLLSLIGSLLGILNFISLVTSYQLIQMIKIKEPHHFSLKIIQFLLFVSIISTIYITLYYAVL